MENTHKDAKYTSDSDKYCVLLFSKYLEKKSHALLLFEPGKEYSIGQTSYQTLRAELFHFLSLQPCWPPHTRMSLYQSSWYLRSSAFLHEPVKKKKIKNTRDNRESVWYKVLSTVTAAGKCELVSVRGSCKRVLKSAPWGVTHRDPVIFEIKASFIFPPEGGGLGMPARRLTLETGSLPDCHNHILWVLSEVIA